mmetsp:Transcript_28384/g.25231  ORF Transcript_28384/g.25231 Transcript_28384/m.25231 type:complete len:86 (+) Transcript_28384:1076-1333(+)|eukprot:CAMPEP_0114576182 /NCGR_PEP_ID=MMETSP0125-20121206/973_1 /TAXON_ID=485358 ORGANISM="Aristerostoma sp., Strain ATCC 50986" /NCGR_SAMPLE_ID=MMETSP0125 /ASSEMBLY_ACC=CAM_ASM_000245 /LENGTH=85 /DNA_ID=CAMNT_0001764499 /DNA_START=1067 /DNA_END=1324 /DNA_ORIENTATION=-
MILEFDVIYGDVDPENFREAFNNVIVAAIPVINQQARAGIKNPLIGQFGLSDIEISVGGDFVRLGVNFEEQSSMKDQEESFLGRI